MSIVLGLLAVLVVLWVAGWIIGYLDATIPGFGCVVSVLPLIALGAGIVALLEGAWGMVGVCVVMFVVGGFMNRVLGAGGGDTYVVPVPVDPPYDPQPPPPPHPGQSGPDGYGYPPGDGYGPSYLDDDDDPRWPPGGR